jgi:hypothetical protein
MSISLDPDAAEGVARIVELVDLITAENGPAASARMVLADVEDATRALQHWNTSIAYSELDHALVAVLALDPDASGWSEVRRIVEDVERCGSPLSGPRRCPRGTSTPTASCGMHSTCCGPP